jgi:hypothetical protein
MITSKSQGKKEFMLLDCHHCSTMVPWLGRILITSRNWHCWVTLVLLQTKEVIILMEPMAPMAGELDRMTQQDTGDLWVKTTKFNV